MINILFLNFSEKNKIKIIKFLANTSFKTARHYKSNFIAMSKNELYWKTLDIIICFGNPLDHLNNTILADVASKIPILFISNRKIENDGNPKYISNFPNYLPLEEVTSFILEKSIYNTIELYQLKKRLEEVKELKNEIKIKERKYKNSFHNNPVGMFEVDKNGNFKIVNKSFLNIVKHNSIRDLGKYNFFEHGFLFNGTGDMLKKKLIEDGMVRNFEDEWVRSDGTKIVVKETIISNRDSAGNLEFFQGVVEDITDRKKFEDALIESKLNAEKSDRLKSEFLTQISHEIRTPINTILSFSTFIKDELNSSITEDLKESFSSINKAGRRIIRTIDLLVKMSELQTDNYEPEFRENDLFEVIEELFIAYKPLAKNKNITLNFIKEIDSAKFLFDRATVYDVLSNLIDNAIKYTNEGSVTIIVKPTDVNKIAVTVSDTGIGISSKYINDIFKPFSQESCGYTRKFDGNGLGLALVKEYCRLNNAKISVISEKNKGSDFTVVFK